MVGFVTTRDRDAWAAIRGFAYQIDQTIESWLDLESPDVLELERGEDIDLVLNAFSGDRETTARQLKQVKSLNKNISLRTPHVLAVLANFYEHLVNNPDLHLTLIFITNVQTAVERPSPMPSSHSAISLWSQLRAKKLMDETFDEVIGGIRTLLASARKPKFVTNTIWQPFIRFVRSTSKEELSEFVGCVDWRMGSLSADLMRSSLQERLAGRFDLAKADAENLYYRVFYRVTEILSHKGEKRLSVEALENLAVTAPLKETEMVGANTVRQILAELEARLTSLEEGHTIHETRLAVIDAQLHHIMKSANPSDAKYSPAQVQLDMPPILEPIVLRSTLTTRLAEQLTAQNWRQVYGDIGSGKTQLALLLAKRLEWPTVWIRFRGLDSNEACTRIDEALQQLSNSKLGQSWSSWCRDVLSQFADATLIVLDDLPRVRPGDLLNERIGDLLKQSNSTNVHFFSTSPFPLPSQIKNLTGLSIVDEEIPHFSNEEVVELFESHGAPSDFCAENRIGLMRAITRGHPTLLVALSVYLSDRNWTFTNEEFDALIKGEYAIEANEQTRIALFRSVPDFDSRELLYRLTLVGSGSFTSEEVQSVSEADPPVLHPFERITQALGLWIQRESANNYVLSPLLQQLGIENLQAATTKEIHLNLAKAIFRKGHIGPEDLSHTIHHYLSADEHDQAARTLIWALYEMSKQEVEYDPWGISAYWSELPLPVAMSLSLRIHLRTMQAVVRARLKKSIDFVLKDLDELLDAATDSEATAIEHATIVAGPLFNETGFSRAIKYLFKLLKLAPNDVLPDGSPVVFPAGFNSPSLIWASVRMVRTDDDILTWFAALEQFTSSQLDAAMRATMAADSAMALADRLWLWEARKPASDRDWKKVLSTLETLARRAKLLNAEVLWACLVRSQIIVLAEYLDNLDGALTVGEESLKFAVRDPAIQFILKMSIGTQLVNYQRFEGGSRYLREALDESTLIYPLFRYASLLKLAEAVGSQDTTEAAALSASAVDVVRTAPELPESELIKVLGEYAISLWLDGNLQSAYEPLEEGAERLLATPANSDEDKALFSLFGHVSGFLTHLVSTGTEIQRTAEDSDYTRPERGMLLRHYPLLAGSYQEDLARFLPVQIAYFARAVGDDEGLAKWSARAIETARDTNAIIQIAPLSLDAELSALHVPDSIDAAMYMGMALIAFQLDEAAGRNPLRADFNIEEVLGKKPNTNWIDAERQAISLGILPWFFHLALLTLEGKSDSSEFLDQLKSVCEEVSQTSVEPELWTRSALLMSDIFDGVGSSELMEQAKSLASGSSEGLQALAFLGAALESFPEQAVHNHLETMPLVIDGLRGMKSTFRKIVIPFYKLFWQRALTEHRFRFRTPSLIQREFNEVMTSNDWTVVPNIPNLIAIGLGVSPSERVRSWLSVKLKSEKA